MTQSRALEYRAEINNKRRVNKQRLKFRFERTRIYRTNILRLSEDFKSLSSSVIPEELMDDYD